MKTLLYLLFIAGSFWVVDVVALDGANSKRIASEAKREARLVNQQFEHWLKKLD